MIKDLYHIAYLTDDLSAAVSWYQTVFDATVVLETVNAASRSRIAYLQVGGTQVELIEPADRERLGGRTGLVFDHIGYLVTNLDAAMAVLATRNITFATSAPRVSPEGARIIYLDAAQALGTRIHLTERPVTPEQ